jgi:hypothetical protein
MYSIIKQNYIQAKLHFAKRKLTLATVQKSSKMAAFYFVYKRLCESVCKDIRIANISPYTDFYATPFSSIETVFFSGLISAITP